MHNVTLSRLAEALCDFLDDSARSYRDLAVRIRASIESPGRPLVVPATKKSARLCKHCGQPLEAGRTTKATACLRQECRAAVKKKYNHKYYGRRRKLKQLRIVTPPARVSPTTLSDAVSHGSLITVPVIESPLPPPAAAAGSPTEEDGSVAEVRELRAERLCLTCKRPVNDIGFEHCYGCRTREAGI